MRCFFYTLKGGRMANKTKKDLPPGYRWKDETTIEHRFSYDGERYSVYGKTVRECDTKKLDALKRLADGLTAQKSRVTFETYSKEWLATLDKSVKPSSVYSYQRKINLLNKHFGKLKLYDIDRRGVKIFRKEIESMKPTTAAYLLSLLRRILQSAVHDRIINYNPAGDITVRDNRPKEETARETIHRALTVEEQQLFFEYARENWYYELMALAVNTGMRAGELGALTWGDISDDCINVCSTVTTTGATTVTIGSTKTAAGTRSIPMNAQIRKIISMQRNKVLEYRGLAYLKPDCNVFYMAQSDSLITPKVINVAIESVNARIVKDGKPAIEHFTSHCFRDTFATRCIEQGMEPNTLKEILGHTKLAITMDLYVHVLGDTKKDAMDQISIIC